MENVSFDTLILSDVHLGSQISRASQALDALRRHDFRRLILLGDIFSDLDFGRLTKEHWLFLSYIRKLSNPKRGVEVVWVEGNHDQGLSKVMSHLVGVPVYKQYVWEFEGKKHLAIHGHQFDRFTSANYWISRMGVAIYEKIQHMGGVGQTLSRTLDRWNTSLLDMSGKVERGALAYAAAVGVDRIFCGHTHEACRLRNKSVEYYNSGSWVDETSTYVTVGEQGVVIRDANGGVDDRHTREERIVQPAAPALLPAAARLPSLALYRSVRC